MIAILIVVFFALLFFAVPVAHSLVIASGASVMWSESLPLAIIAQQMFQQTQCSRCWRSRSSSWPAA